MCGRYTLTNPDEIAARFGLLGFTETRIEPRFNVAPSQQVPVIVEREDGPTLTTMRWGFQPSWMRTDGQRPPPINARSESLLDRPTFRDAVVRGRCLIPADGFYEWQTLPGQRKKQPMYVRLRDGEPFAFAGLYVQGPDRIGETCVIVTMAAHETLASIHERMPVMLDRAVERRWLDRTLTDGPAALNLLQPAPPERYEAYAVSSLVSSARNEGPALIERADTTVGTTLPLF